MSILTVTTTADAGTGSLREIVNLAKSGDTIKFSSDLANKVIVLRTGEIDISPGKNLTIDAVNAPGLAISGNKSSRIFLVDSNQDRPASLTLKNVQIRNGYSREQGGAIHVTHKGGLTVENVNFTTNAAVKGGGAIYSAWDTNLTVINSTFIENDGTGANKEVAGGAITFASPGKFTVLDSEFYRNRGINGGAIYSLNGKLTVDDSTFIGNDTTAGYYHTNNPRPFLRGYGGAIYTDRASSANATVGGTISITDSVFKDNKARGEGGAAYLYTAPKDKVLVEGSLFQNNQVSALPGGSPGFGGGIVQLTNGKNQGFTLRDSAFINNRANSQGGGLWVFGAPTKIFNSTFSGNAARGGNNTRGGAMMLYSDTVIDDTTVAYNQVDWYGGGISRGSTANVSVSDSIFYYNKANNSTGTKQQVQDPLIDRGGNFQYPPGKNSADNVTTVIETDVDPKLGALKTNGGIVPFHPVNNSVVASTGAGSTTTSVTAATFNPSELSLSESSINSNGETDSLLATGTPLSATTGVDTQDSLLSINANNVNGLTQSEQVPSLQDEIIYGTDSSPLSVTSGTNGLVTNNNSSEILAGIFPPSDLSVESSLASGF